jgi:hypothetical protein
MIAVKLSPASSELITHVLRAVQAPIFAAAWASDGAGDVLFVHVAATPGRALIRRQIRQTLAAIGVDRARIRFHSGGQLEAPRSLERLVARFGGDDIVYDPTEAVGRAKALVCAGRTVRTVLADKLAGLYYAPRQRAFFVALKASKLVNGERIKVGELANIECAVADAMRAEFALGLDDYPAVRVGFGLPQTPLVAVDSASIMGWSRRLTRLAKRYWKPLTIAAAFGFGMTAGAQAKEPAVSQTNLKLTTSGGEVEGEGAWELGGALTTPLGQDFGLQLEAGALSADGHLVYGGAGHVFYRDPDKYLIGLFAAYTEENDFNLDALRAGAEAEIYLDQISILAQAGYQFSDSIGDKAFGSIDLRWYATDNFYFSAGGHFEEDATQARLGAEFMPGFSALPGLAFNMRGVVGDDDFESVMGGITYYFGANDSLKNRHRRQDPESALLGLFHSVEKERAKLAAIYGD